MAHAIGVYTLHDTLAVRYAFHVQFFNFIPAITDITRDAANRIQCMPAPGPGRFFPRYNFQLKAVHSIVWKPDLARYLAYQDILPKFKLYR